MSATYALRVELSGFSTAEIKELVLRDGETVRQTLTIPVASIAEAVTVVGESPLLQTGSATVGVVIDAKILEEIPVAGRTVLDVTTLAPGVTPRDFNRTTFFGRRDQYVTVEGGRDSSTNYAIDGVYVRSLRWNNMSVTPALDSVQEVNLLRNSFSTEYGQGQAVVAGDELLDGLADDFQRAEAGVLTHALGEEHIASWISVSPDVVQRVADVFEVSAIVFHSSANFGENSLPQIGTEPAVR